MTTLDPSEPVTVSVTFDGTNVHLAFGIPRGNDGANGEVSAAQLNSAIAGTAPNLNSFPPYTGTFSDPPTQSEMQSFAAYVEQMRQALMR